MPRDPRYQNCASRAYKEYKTWLVDLLKPLLLSHLLDPICTIIINYITMEERDHFEAVITIRPKMFGFVCEYNVRKVMENWISDSNPNKEDFIWPKRIIIETVDYFNNSIFAMLDEIKKITNHWDYREVSIFDQYNLNAKCIMKSNWPIATEKLEVYKGRPRDA